MTQSPTPKEPSPDMKQCKTCKRVSDVVNLEKDCPFCHDTAPTEGWESELENLPAVNYNLYFGSPAHRRDNGDENYTYENAVSDLKSYIRSLLSRIRQETIDRILSELPEDLKEDNGSVGVISGWNVLREKVVTLLLKHRAGEMK